VYYLHFTAKKLKHIDFNPVGFPVISEGIITPFAADYEDVTPCTSVDMYQRHGGA
jgi:hypothetical protein